MVHDGDPQQIALVRSHLRKEPTAFARGDFSDPAKIHWMTMPGLAQLHAGASRTAVSYLRTTNGASIRYKTSDPQLVAAVHEWFGAQVEDHGAHAMVAPDRHVFRCMVQATPDGPPRPPSVWKRKAPTPWPIDAEVFRGEGDAVDAVARLHGPFRVEHAEMIVSSSMGELEARQRTTLVSVEPPSPVWREIEYA